MPTKNTEPITLTEFQERFATEEACVRHLFKIRWPNGFVCPSCGKEKCYELHSRGLYQCAHCRYQASVTAGTIMHRAKLPLRYWFLAMFLFATDKRGCSALSLKSRLHICYESAWLMLHKIRKAMGERDFRYMLSGVVEVDDAYFGGVSENQPGSHKHTGRGTTKTKTAVGLSLREGKPGFLKMQTVVAMTSEELSGFVLDNVEPGAKVFTDYLNSYNEVGSLGYEHECQLYDWENPEHLKWIHIIISNTKAFIAGTYHGLGSRHFQAYLDEYCFRFNRRFRPDEIFSRLIAACVDCQPFTLAELTR